MSHQTHKPAVLVVDDDSLLLDLVAAYLASDFAVTVATDAMDGLAKFDHRDFDVVVVDRAMPGMLGDRFAAQIKQRQPSTPIILISGFHSAPPEMSLFSAVLHKPFTQEALLEAVRNAILLGARSNAE